MSGVCRKKEFKKGLDECESRRRRGENSVSLRKAKREEGLAKRRNLTESNIPETEVPCMNGESPSKKTYTVKDLSSLRLGLQSSDISIVVESTRGIRKILSVESNPPVEDVLAANVLPMLISFLGREESNELQFEAAWALTNIASTDRTNVVVENGAIPPLIQLLTHKNAEIREQCAWCLGNIAGDCFGFRDIILQNNGLQGLLLNICEPASISMLRNATWALSNFCRGKPQPALEIVQPAIPVLAQLLLNTDQETVIDACWALSYLSDGEDDRIQAVVNTGIVRHLTTLLASSSSAIVTPTLRTLGNIVTGNDVQTQSVIDADIWEHSINLLHHNKKAIRKETCWMLSNIAAGTKPQINALMNAPGVIPAAIQQLTSGEWEVRKEACWIISNITTGGTFPHVQQLIDYGCVKPVCDLLDVSDSKVIIVALDAIEAIMNKGAQNGVNFSVMIDEADGIEKIEKLQEHENSEVYEKAVSILEEFFAAEEDEDENFAPQAPENSTSFTFGVSQQPQTFAF